MSLSQAAQTPEIKHPAASETLKMLEVNLLQVLPEYEDPLTVPVWRWVQENASFSQTAHDAFEFLVNVESVTVSGKEIPAELNEYFEFAKAHGHVWILFFQS